jgi:hypothetical protein
MKNCAKIIVLFILLVNTDGQAQMNGMNGNGMNRVGNGVGLDRSIGGDNRQSEPPKKEPVDYVQVMANNLTTKLSLDSFQSVVVKNLIEEYVKNTNNIALENIPNDAKTEKIKIAKNAMEAKFFEMFSDKQKTQFDELTKQNTPKKKNKQNKKDQKESEE